MIFIDVNTLCLSELIRKTKTSPKSHINKQYEPEMEPVEIFVNVPEGKNLIHPLFDHFLRLFFVIFVIFLRAPDFKHIKQI